DLERDAALLGVAERRRVGRVRDAEDAVRLGRLLPGELPSQRAACAVHADAPELGVRPGEVDQLEDARRETRRRGEASQPGDLVAVDADQLPRLEVPHVLRPQQVQCAGLARENVAPAAPPEDEWSEPPG